MIAQRRERGRIVDRAPHDTGLRQQRGRVPDRFREKPVQPAGVELRGSDLGGAGRAAYLLAAVTMISTFQSGEARALHSPARTGDWPGATQASHTAFMAAKFRMSVTQS